MTDEPQAEDPQEKPPNAVVIHVQRDESGKVNVTPQPLGDVLPTEVETILGSALTSWRATNRLPT